MVEQYRCNQFVLYLIKQKTWHILFGEDATIDIRSQIKLLLHLSFRLKVKPFLRYTHFHQL